MSMEYDKKSTKKRLAQFLICAGVVLFFVPLSLLAAWQFTTSGLQTDVNGGVTKWRDNGGIALTPYHTETNGWTYSERVGKGIVFDAQSSPLAFSSAKTEKALSRDIRQGLRIMKPFYGFVSFRTFPILLVLIRRSMVSG